MRPRPSSSMPNCLRTVLLPPSQPTMYRVLILAVSPSVYLTSASTPEASCANLLNSHPHRTPHFAALAPTHFTPVPHLFCANGWQRASRSASLTRRVWRDRGKGSAGPDPRRRQERRHRRCLRCLARRHSPIHAPAAEIERVPRRAAAFTSNATSPSAEAANA